MTSPRDSSNTPQAIPPGLAVTVILAQGVIALVIPSFIEGAGMSSMIAIILAIVAVTELVIARFVLFPAMAKYPQANFSALWFSFSVAPATYAIVVAILTGEHLWAIPFTVLALVTWATLWSFVRELPTTPRDIP